MNQEKIGKLIREIRKKSGLTQEKFALKYGVTYQAVSKWENGKNIPDIAILKEICNEYNIDFNDLLDVEPTSKKRNKKKLLLVMILILILGGLCLFLVFSKDNHDFQFKKLSTTCDNFNLYGSIAYNDNMTSIYISNITYCGASDNNEYQKIECNLYESNNDIEIKISSYSYQEDTFISLEDFLKEVEFNVDHYSKTCKTYQENNLYLEIEATNTNNQIIFYKIPLKLEDNCNE